MSFNKKFFTTGGIVAASEGVCLTEDVNPFTGEVADGGVALYSLDYDASDTGDTYDGTPTNVDFGVGGQINYGARFNGSSSTIDTGYTPPIGSNDFSISCWLNWSGASTDGVWSTFTNSGTDRKGINLSIHSSGRVDCTVFDSAGGASVSSNNPSTISTGQWVNVVITYEGGLTKMYIDKTLQTSTVNQVITGHHASLHLGNYYASLDNANMFEGDLDQVRIFESVLSQSQVDTLYEETACVHTATTNEINYPTTNTAYYKLDGSAEDSHGNTYDGTESNITYEFGRYGQAAVFNGSSSNIELPNLSLGITDSSNFSISYWFNTNSTTQDNQSVVWANASNAGARFGTGLNSPSQGGDTSVFFGMPINGSLTYINSGTSAFTANTWVHVVCVKSSTTGMSLYVDNVLKATNTGATGSGSATATGKNTIGSYYTGGPHGSFFNGSIDQVRIYSTALTPDQVTELYEEKQDYITKDASDPFGDSSEDAFYEMENNSNDSTGSNNGQDTSMTYTQTEPIRGSYEANFNGTSSFFDLGFKPAIGSGQFSVSFWVNVDDLSGTTGFISTIRDAVTDRQGFNVHVLSSGSIRYLIYGTGGAIILDSDENMIPLRWYHIVATYNNGAGNLYIDGNLQEYTGGTKLITAHYGNIQVGKYFTNTTTILMDGKIDHLRIFDKELDGTEAYQLYAEGARGTGL